MVIISGRTKRVEIPHESGEWMELQRLSWSKLEQASDAQTERVLDRVRRLGGDILRELQQLAGEQKQDPTAQYDRMVILCAGIKGWSYPEEPTIQNIGLLDETTAVWAFREILAMNNPQTEEERKNDL